MSTSQELNKIGEPIDWSFEPIPQVSGWFAVLVCWEPGEGVFTESAWAENGIFAKHLGCYNQNGSSGHAGPFPTKEAADQWGLDHDING